MNAWSAACLAYFRACSTSISRAAARSSPAWRTTAGSASRSPRRWPRRARPCASAPGRRRSTSSSTCSSAERWTSRAGCRSGALLDVREDLSARRRVRHATTRCPEERPRRTSATRTSATARSTGWRERLVGGLRRAAARHRRALARERPRGEEAAARDEPRRLPRRGERERVLARVDGRSASARSCATAARSSSLTYMASERVIPGYGGGMSSAKAALESDTRTLAFEAGRKCGMPREHDLRRPVRVARGERDRHHRARWWSTCRRTRRSPSSSTADGGRQRRRVPLLAAGERHHRHDGLRRQGLPRDGHGGGKRG